MKRNEDLGDDMRVEYDFSDSRKSPYAALAGDVHVVTLDEDVFAAFPDSTSVNQALRLLLHAARGAVNASSKSAAELPKAS